MQSSSSEQTKLVTRVGGKWKMLSRNTQNGTLQEKGHNKENEIRIGNKREMVVGIEGFEGCETLSKKIKAKSGSLYLNNNKSRKWK